QVSELPPYLVARWSGAGSEAACEVARQAVGELLARAGERIVLDLGRLQEVGDGVARALAGSITEAHRHGRTVCLVRCSDALFRRLQAAGVTGGVVHTGSMLAATQGLTGDATGILDLHLRSTPELLSRLRHVVSAVAREAGLGAAPELQLTAAVNETVTNAIVHGSPEGVRNHVRVSFHLEPTMLIVDVADQGPGFDSDSLKPLEVGELAERGYGLHIVRQCVDRTEFYRGDRGMLVRMTKLLGPPVRG
ncbi:MAG TPA: ATP-binding protein, partial [Armatimonadota bacterium]|nr:ATP-binding protein [Armatimonadota bacterium]